MAFQSVLSLQDLPPGSMRAVTVAGTSILFVREGDQMYAMEPRCGHAGGPLPEGTLQGHVVTCPWHGSQWDARSGRALSRSMWSAGESVAEKRGSSLSEPAREIRTLGRSAHLRSHRRYKWVRPVQSSPPDRPLPAPARQHASTPVRLRPLVVYGLALAGPTIDCERLVADWSVGGRKRGGVRDVVAERGQLGRRGGAQARRGIHSPRGRGRDETPPAGYLHDDDQPHLTPRAPQRPSRVRIAGRDRPPMGGHGWPCPSRGNAPEV